MKFIVDKALRNCGNDRVHSLSVRVNLKRKNGC